MGTGGRLDAPDDSSLAVDLERLDRRRTGTVDEVDVEVFGEQVLEVRAAFLAPVVDVRVGVARAVRPGGIAIVGIRLDAAGGVVVRSLGAGSFPARHPGT